MAEQNVVAQIDSAIGDFFSQWNWASTIIVGLILIVVIYPIFAGKEADVHPFLLARQTQASPIRQPGESAVYRSTEIPYGYPLRSGLAIKDPGASKWTTGRDGDLRDIWRQAVTGPKKEDGSSAGPSAKITTILGTEKIIEHNLRDLTSDINVIGESIKNAGGRKVAVCLSDSTELLCTIFGMLQIIQLLISADMLCSWLILQLLTHLDSIPSNTTRDHTPSHCNRFRYFDR